MVPKPQCLCCSRWLTPPLASAVLLWIFYNSFSSRCCVRVSVLTPEFPVPHTSFRTSWPSNACLCLQRAWPTSQSSDAPSRPGFQVCSEEYNSYPRTYGPGLHGVMLHLLRFHFTTQMILTSRDGISRAGIILGLGAGCGVYGACAQRPLGRIPVAKQGPLGLLPPEKCSGLSPSPALCRDYTEPWWSRAPF